eukprot:scaffold6323_cov203-Alexandrium_tamarense.AAC.29
MDTGVRQSHQRSSPGAAEGGCNNDENVVDYGYLGEVTVDDVSSSVHERDHEIPSVIDVVFNQQQQHGVGCSSTESRYPSLHDEGEASIPSQSQQQQQQQKSQHKCQPQLNPTPQETTMQSSPLELATDIRKATFRRTSSDLMEGHYPHPRQFFFGAGDKVHPLQQQQQQNVVGRSETGDDKSTGSSQSRRRGGGGGWFTIKQLTIFIILIMIAIAVMIIVANTKPTDEEYKQDVLRDANGELLKGGTTSPSKTPLSKLPTVSSLYDLPTIQPSSDDSSPSTLLIDACFCGGTILIGTSANGGEESLGTISQQDPTNSNPISYQCTLNSAIYIDSPMTICISISNHEDDREYDVQLSLLNVTHELSGTKFQVVIPFESKIANADSNTTYQPTIAMSPWAPVSTNTEQTLMVFRLERLLHVWFGDEFMTGENTVDVDGRLWIKSWVATDVERLFDGHSMIEGGKNAQSTSAVASAGGSILSQSTEDFHLTAELLAPPTMAPSNLHNTNQLYIIDACICDSNNTCYEEGSYVMYRSLTTILRICLIPQQHVGGEAALVTIQWASYLRLQKEGEYGFPFDVINDKYISPLATFELVPGDNATEGNIAVITVDLFPEHFFDPSDVVVTGIADVNSTIPTTSDLFGDDAQPPNTTMQHVLFDTVVKIVDVPSAMPSAAPSIQSAVVACRCSDDEQYRCLDEEPMVKYRRNSDHSPDVHICIKIRDIGSGALITELSLLQIDQERTDLSLSLIGEGSHTRSFLSYQLAFLGGGALVTITINQLSMFYEAVPPMPNVVVWGIALVGDDASRERFSVSIPLEIAEHDEVVPCPSCPSMTPSESSLPTRTSMPSSDPTASAVPSVTSVGILACLCDPLLVSERSDGCVTKYFSQEDNIISVCLRSRPASEELTELNLVLISQQYIDGISRHDILVEGGLVKDNIATSVVYDDEYHRSVIVTSVIGQQFFDDVQTGQYKATMQGFAVLTASNGHRHDSPFDVEFYLEAPTISSSPSGLGSLNPISLINGPERGVEVWSCLCNPVDMMCTTNLLTRRNNNSAVCTFSTREIVEVKVLIYQREDSASHSVVVNGSPMDDTTIVINETKSAVVTVLPDYFFDGVDTINDGKVRR